MEALSVRQVAALLHCSEPTVRKYLKLGELSSALIGRCRRIRRLDLELFLDRRTAYGWRPYEPGVAPAFDSPIDPPDIDGSVPF